MSTTLNNFGEMYSKQNPLLSLAAKHLLINPVKAVAKIPRSLSRSTNYATSAIADRVFNPALLDFTRSVFGRGPMRTNRVRDFSNDGTPRRYTTSRRDSYIVNQLQDLNTQNASILSQIRNLVGITIQNERHLRNISRSIGNTNTSNRRNQRVNPRVNPFRPDSNPMPDLRPQPLNPTSRGSTGSSRGLGSNLLSMILGGVNAGSAALGGPGVFSTILGTAVIPKLLRLAKSATFQLIKKIPLVGTIIGLALNIPEAVEEYERNGLGAATKDLLAGLTSDLTFNLVSKDTIKKAINDITEPFVKMFSDVQKSLQNSFMELMRGIWGALGNLKFDINLPEALGGKITIDPFKDQRKLSRFGMTDEEYDRSQTLGDTTGYTAKNNVDINEADYDNFNAQNIRYDREAEAQRLSEQINRGETTVDQVTKNAEDKELQELLKKNLQIVQPWEDEKYKMNKGDIITPESLKEIFGVSNDRYKEIVDSLKANGTIRFSNEPPTNKSWWMKPNTTVSPEKIEPQKRRFNLFGDTEISPIAMLAKVDSKIASMIEGRKIEPWYTKENGFNFSQRDPATYGASSGQNQSQQPILINNAPVTNYVTGASNEGGSIGSATNNRNSWEERATFGIADGIP